MTGRVSAIIPVKDGGRYLGEVLGALARQGVDEIVVVDSGSRDGSVEIARAAGARVEQIAPHAFGHGRTRNLGAELAQGELLAFLTQDASRPTARHSRWIPAWACPSALTFHAPERAR